MGLCVGLERGPLSQGCQPQPPEGGDSLRAGPSDQGALMQSAQVLLGFPRKPGPELSVSLDGSSPCCGWEQRSLHPCSDCWCQGRPHSLLRGGAGTKAEVLSYAAGERYKLSHRKRGPDMEMGREKGGVWEGGRGKPIERKRKSKDVREERRVGGKGIWGARRGSDHRSV